MPFGITVYRGPALLFALALSLAQLNCGSSDDNSNSPSDRASGSADASTSDVSASGGHQDATVQDGSATSNSSGSTSSGSSSGSASSGSSGGSSTSGSSGGGSGTSTSSGGGSGSSGGSGASGSSSGSSASGGTSGGATSSGSGSSSGASSGGIDAGTPAPQAQAYNGARGTSFNSGWKFHLGDVSGAQATAFDDSSWRSLDVPHDWSIELQFNPNSPAGHGGGLLDGGIGWYRKTFTLDPSYSGQKIRIEFDGVYENSEVWINGTSLGTRPYGYSTFEYDLTPNLNAGASNVVAVKVDNSNQPNSRWYSGSGIYRNVWLTALNPVHIAYNGGFVTTPSVSATSATVSIAADVENQSTSSQSVTMTAEIDDATGVKVVSNTLAASSVAGSTTSTLTQSLTVSSPHLWSIDDPYLYRVKLTLQVNASTVDTYVVPVGLRSYDFDASKGFSLNGKSMKIWGMANHHDFGAIGTAYHYRALQRFMQVMKGMGVNALRTSHNPPVPELLDLADQMGFLVMDEAFDVWETGKNGLNDYHLYFTKWAQADIQDFVRRDRNHASVIMWSIGNEIQGASTGTAANLMKWVKAIDSTRPVTWACNNMGDATNQAVAALLDLQGYNYLQNGSVTSPIFDGQHAAHPTWKIFGSEMESGARSRGFYSTADDNPSSWGNCDDSVMECSDYPDTNASPAGYEGMYVIENSRPWFAGEFDWTGFDYGGEPWPYANNAKSSYFGIVDTAGFPKNGYYFWQSRNTTAPMVHISPHWNWTSGTTVNVLVYSNCDSVELFLNGTSQGSKANTSTTTHLEWSVPWASGTLKAACTTAGTVAATDQVTTAGAPAKVGLSVDRTTIAADGRDLAYVTANVQDSAGVFVPTANSSITFAVSGPGKLAGADNGDPIDLTAFSSATRKAFNGKALAIVQSTGQAGTIVVSATSSGLTAGSLTANAM